MFFFADNVNLSFLSSAWAEDRRVAIEAFFTADWLSGADQTSELIDVLSMGGSFTTTRVIKNNL